MNTALTFRTIQLHIDLLSSPRGSGNSLTESARKDIKQIAFDLIDDLRDLGVLDSIAYHDFMDKLSIAYVNGGL